MHFCAEVSSQARSMLRFSASSNHIYSKLDTGGEVKNDAYSEREFAELQA
jgi:hypothetical protein